MDKCADCGFSFDGNVSVLCEDNIVRCEMCAGMEVLA